MVFLKHLLESIKQNYDASQIKKLNEIYEKLQTAKEQTKNQAVFSSELKKGIQSAKILCKVKMDMDTIIASLTLNLVKKGLIDSEKIGLNKNITTLIEDTKNFETLHYSNKKEDANNLRAMFVSMVKDIRTLILKLADITVIVTSRKEGERTPELDYLHKEIKEIYAPLAARLGLSFIKSTLQDENMKYLEEATYKKLEEELNKNALPRQIALNKTIKRLEKMLKELNIEGHIYGRLKHISSIYKKMQGRAKGSLANVLDIVAVRIIVENVTECYTLLGHVHTIYEPVENVFRDYISKPKPNGYKSLHTTVYVDNNQVVEIQIRTQEMHDFAEYGVAAHWLYKENKAKQNSLDKKLTWIRQILETADSLSANEMIDELRTNDYDGEIYVQTPKGNIIELPLGSTPVDFAYNVHSEVGNKCVGAKVNGKMVPLNTPLNNGEVVEIITSTTSKGPSRDWLKFIKSVSARSKINAYFKKERKEDNIKRGKSILEQAAKAKNLALHKLLDEKYLKDAFERYSLASLDDMYASIGHGSLTANQILTKLTRLEEEANKKEPSEILKIKETPYKDNKQDVIVIKGLDNLLTRFAKCCTPIPGDEVVGYISRGKGATIHRANCKTLNQLESERLIKAEWGNIMDATYAAQLNIIVKNYSGALASITNKIAELKINIYSVSSNQISNERSIIHLVIQITKQEQLNEVINKLKTLNSVYEVYRNSDN